MVVQPAQRPTPQKPLVDVSGQNRRRADIGRIERYEKEWNRLHAADPAPKPAPRLVLETTK